MWLYYFYRLDVIFSYIITLGLCQNICFTDHDTNTLPLKLNYEVRKNLDPFCSTMFVLWSHLIFMESRDWIIEFHNLIRIMGIQYRLVEIYNSIMIVHNSLMDLHIYDSPFLILSHLAPHRPMINWSRTGNHVHYLLCTAWISQIFSLGTCGPVGILKRECLWSSATREFVQQFVETNIT